MRSLSSQWNCRIGFTIICFLIFTVAYYKIQMVKFYSFLNNLQMEQRKLVSKIEFNKEVTLNDNTVVVYNRVPKTASTSFVGIAYDLCKKNKFHVLHINVTSNNHILSLSNQLNITQNISNWNSVKPAFYHGHFAFIDFEKFGNKQPYFINIVRKPLDRMISYYYFLRYGDDFRPYLIRKKHGNKMTFDECVVVGHADCNPNNMWLQVPFFCGHASNCWKPANKWALTEAKKNLINNYLLVGVTEELDEFVEILEHTLPNIFFGATEYFLKSNRSHLRQTLLKSLPSEKTISKIKNSAVWQMENDFYQFALDQFHFVKKQTKVQQKYIYEKIRPK